MICPYYKNKEVFDGFNEMIEALGGKPMTEEEFRSSELRNQRTGLDYSAMETAYRLYHKNGGNFLDLAPNGEPSILFQSLLDYCDGNKAKAIILKSNVYSNNFITWFGDWTAEDKENVSKVVDQNGEPLVVYHHSNDENLNEFSIDFDNYFSKDGGTKKAVFFDEEQTGTLNRKYDFPVYLNIRELSEYNETKQQLHDRGTTYRQIVNESAEQNDVTGGVHMKDFDDNKKEHQSIWIVHNQEQIRFAVNSDSVQSNKRINKPLGYSVKLDKANTQYVFGMNTGALMLEGSNTSSSIVLQNLIDQQLLSDENIKLARIIQRHNIPILFGELENGKLAATITDKSGGSVVIVNPDEVNNVTNQYLADTILHEAIHALTVNALDNPITQQEKAFADTSRRTYSLFNKIVPKNSRYNVYDGSYIMQNEKEFASIFITDDNARSYIYDIARRYDKSNKLKNIVKKFINSIVNLFTDKTLFDTTTAVETLNQYRQDLLDHLYNKSTVEYGNISSEQLLDILFQSAVGKSFVGDSIQQAIQNAELNDTNLQINYNSVPEVAPKYDFESIARTLMTRLQVIKRSNMGKSEIGRQSQLIESQASMLIHDDFSVKYQALKSLAAQLGPQLHEDYQYLKTLPDLQADEYMTIMHTNIGTYHQIARMCDDILGNSNIVSKIIQSSYTGKPTGTEEGDAEFNRFRNTVIKDVIRLKETFEKIKNLSDNCQTILGKLRTKSTRALLLDIGRAVNDPDIENYVTKIEKIDFDTNGWFTRNVGAADAAEDTALRALAYLVNNADTKTDLEMVNIASRLAKALKGLDKSKLKQLYERDLVGDTTGYLIRDKNYGVFYNEYNDEIIKINRAISQKYGIQLEDNNRLAPTEKEARKEWNKLRNDWLEKHCDRRYVNEYYRAQEELSTEALLRMQAINSQIYQINMLPGVINPETGKPDYYNLTDEQWQELQNLITKKKFLRREVDEWGNQKSDAELEIAHEIDAYYKKLYPENGTEIAKDFKAWEDARQKVFNECGGQEEFDKMVNKESHSFDIKKWNKWNQRNSKLSFIEDSDGKPLVFKQIELEFGQTKPYYGDEEAAVAKEINKLLSTFYGTNLIVNERAITKSMQNHIKNLISKQIKLRKKAISQNPSLEKLSKKYGAIFNSYIEFVSTKRFNELQKEAAEQAMEQGGDFEDLYYTFLQNYGTLIEDWTTGEILGFRPYRWFTKMQAKDINRWMVWQPGDAYNDIENSKSLRNEYFDDSEGVSFIPLVKDHKTGKMLNRQYDNSKNYAKVHKTVGMEAMYDEKLSNMYETVLSVMKESNAKLTNRTHVDNYLLPQISGTLYKRMTSNKMEGGYFHRKWKIFTEWIGEKFGIRKETTEDDPLFGETIQLDDRDETGTNIGSNRRNINDIGLDKNMPDGRSMHIIPQYFMNKKAPQYISQDLLGIVFSYARMASNYKNKVEIKDKCEMIVDMLANREIEFKPNDSKSIQTIKGTESKTYDFAQKFLEMNLYDIRRVNKSIKTSPNAIWQYTKALDLLKNYTTANNLGMNPKVSIVGVLTSQWNHLINALCGNGYSFGDADFGGREVIHQMVKSVITGESYIGNISSENKLMVIDEFYNVQNQLEKKLTNSNINRGLKVAKEQYVFGMMSGLDFVSKSGIAVSILHSFRFVDGEWVSKDMIYRNSVKIKKEERKKWLNDKLNKYKDAKKYDNLYSSITVKDGKFFIADENKRKAYNDNIHHIVKSRIEKLAERADGMATKTQKAAITQSVLGAMVLVHRQYLPLMLQERFGKEVYDYDMAMMKNGQLSSLLGLCKQLMAASMFSGAALGGLGSYIIFQSLGGPGVSTMLTVAGALLGGSYGFKNSGTSKSTKEILNDFLNDESTEYNAVKSLYHKRILKQVAWELFLYHAVLNPLINWICAKADDDKSEWWLQFAALVLRQFQWEAYTPYRFDDIFNNFKSVSATTGTLDYIENSVGGGSALTLDLAKMILYNTLLNDEDKVERDKVTRGVYKNWDKEFKNIYNSIPLHNLYKQGFYAPIWRSLEESPTIDSGKAIGPYSMRKYSENQIFKINE